MHYLRQQTKQKSKKYFTILVFSFQRNFLLLLNFLLIKLIFSWLLNLN
jgi:hypothetical protein